MDPQITRRFTRPGRYRRPTIAVVLAMLALGSVSATVLAADTAVEIKDFAFVPASATVSVGDAVTWTNADSAPHTATADDGSFDTGTLNQDGSESVTFDTAGTFPYHCEIHPEMTGTVVVEAAAATDAPAPTDAPVATDAADEPTVTEPPTDTAAPVPATGSDHAGGVAAVLVAVAAVGVGLAIRNGARSS